jgi:multidrug efflux pump subunit AcrB
MWIVKLALSRPYTFIVLAILILVISPLVILRTPTDIFPEINIPVVSVVWGYSGLSAEEMETRIISIYERGLSTDVDDIEHIESQSLKGIAVVKIFLQPHASMDLALGEVTAISQTLLRSLPPGTQPPLVISYTASSVPILQLGLSSPTLSEQELNDIGLNFLRTRLATVHGAAIPFPYGGKLRQVRIDLDAPALQAHGLSPLDVVTAVNAQNLILPGGTAKMGPIEYDVNLNGSPNTIDELNDLPVRTSGGATTYLRDVGYVHDGFAPQTNIVRQDGRRGVLLTIQKIGSASTLSIVSQVRALLPSAQAALPPDLKIQPLADQSLFVRSAVSGVVREGVIAACLTAIMILLFLGSWRSTLIIAISIPLSILTSLMVLGALGETINVMTLGGLALAVGILVDDATVTIENIDRNLGEGKDLHTGILDGAAQIAVPALVSTLSICIVFLPMFFLTGVARYLFVPLAEAVVFAMLASYVLSRTLVPTLAMYLLRARPHDEAGAPPAGRFARLHERFQSWFERGRTGYRSLLSALVERRRVFVPAFLAGCLGFFILVPWLGRDFFPSVDSGQFKLHVRARTGIRIEETARLCDLVEASIRATIPKAELVGILDNIGLPTSGINLSYSNSAPIGSGDADILVSLAPGHRPTEEYVHQLRLKLAREFPGVTFAFLPADIVSQILNFGLPAPLDVQIVGPSVQANRRFADSLLAQLKQVPGAVDLRIQQAFDQPRLQVIVDRTKALQSGLTQRDIASSMLVSLSGTGQTSPAFWLNSQNGVSYNLVAQTPQYALDSLQDLGNIPLSGMNVPQPAILDSFGSVARGSGMGVVSHYNVQRVIDIFGSVHGRDLGGVAADVDRIVQAGRKNLPRGSEIAVRGQVQTMQSSFSGLLSGLALAVVLVYLLMVVNFQSWLDPFIILTALPAALAGMVFLLFLTGTTISVPALMGAIMSVGVATANSILVVNFAKEHLGEHGDAVEAALAAGYARFRPVVMTALAMIIGMVPMALGLGEGGEQNAPLGRAVVGGLLFATMATLVFVPAVFSLLHGRQPAASPVRRKS